MKSKQQNALFCNSVKLPFRTGKFFLFLGIHLILSQNLFCSVYINEVMVRPLYAAEKNESYSCNEYVEIYNSGLLPLSLSGWKLTDISADADDVLIEYHGIYKIGLAGLTIPPMGYALVIPNNYMGTYHSTMLKYVHEANLIMLTLPDLRFLKYGLTDERGSIALYSSEGRIVSSFSWNEKTDKGISWQRLPNTTSDGIQFWGKDYSGGTPGYSHQKIQQNAQAGFSLYPQIYNPFNNNNQPLICSFNLNTGEKALLSIYTIRGVVKRKTSHPGGIKGQYELHWFGKDQQGSRLNSGMYIAVLSIKQTTTNSTIRVFKKTIVILDLQKKRR